MDMIPSEWPHKTAGALAYTAFKDRILQIDFANGRVRISGIVTGAMPLAEPSNEFSFITFGKGRPPNIVAQGFEVNGKHITAQLDTMYTGSLLIYSASIGKLGLSEDSKADVIESFPFTDGGVKMKVAVAHDESFGGILLGPNGTKIYFPTPGVHEPDGFFDGTVGTGLLKGTVLTVDFHNRRISVQRPKA